MRQDRTGLLPAGEGTSEALDKMDECFTVANLTETVSVKRHKARTLTSDYQLS
jgi:hypothetical protein